MYKVKEVFYSIQGEGFHAGRAAVFCRFSGCNLWDGTEPNRRNAICRFCDTDFRGGTRYGIDELTELIDRRWPGDKRFAFVVFTGGEPMLQLDEALVASVARRGFYTAL